MLHAFLVTVHVLVCLALIGVVLLQQGKGADMGAVFGGSSQTLFGSAGATTFLGKMTALAAAVFMLTSLSLTYQAAHRYKTSVMPEQPSATAPAAPQSTAPPAAVPRETQPAPQAESEAAPAPPPAEDQSE